MRIVAAAIFSETSWGMKGAPNADDSSRIGVIRPVFRLPKPFTSEEEPDNCYNTRSKASSSSQNTLVTFNVCRQLGLPPSPNLIGEITHTIITYFMVSVTLSHSRICHSVRGYLFPDDIPALATRNTFCKDYKSFFLFITRAFASRTSHSALSTHNNKSSFSINYLIKVV